MGVKQNDNQTSCAKERGDCRICGKISQREATHTRRTQEPVVYKVSGTSPVQRVDMIQSICPRTGPSGRGSLSDGTWHMLQRSPEISTNQT